MGYNQSTLTEKNGSQAPLLTRIRQNISRMSTRHKMVAEYILKNYEDAAFMTSTQLAENSGVSEATIVRFANKMDFERYADFQQALRKHVRGKLSQSGRLERITTDRYDFDSPMQVVLESMQTDVTSIEKTMAQLNEKTFLKVVNLLSNAHKVYVVASHAEYGFACYFASTLSWIRDDVLIPDNAQFMMYDCMSQVTKDDVVFAISWPPYPGPTLTYQEIAFKKGAHTITLTDSPNSLLVPYTEHLLLAHNEQMFFADNAAPILSMLTAILALVGNCNYERSSQKLKKLRTYWNATGFYNPKQTQL